MNPLHLRSYLLGRLSPDEREQIERRAFEDDVFESLLREAETDLLDDWARSRLSPADAQAVRERFSREKRALAIQLARKAVPVRRFGFLWAAAAALVLCLVPAAYFLTNSRPPVPKVSPAQPPVAGREVAVLALRAPSTRGAAVPVLTIARSAAVVRLVAGAIPGYAQYEVRIEAADRGPVAAKTLDAGAGPLSVDIDSELLPDGGYDVLVSGRNAGVSQLLATYSFRLERR